MKGSRRYKLENRKITVFEKCPRKFGYDLARKPNWWTRFKKAIRKIIGRK